MVAGLLEFHDAANIFPMDDEHIEELASDIETNGLSVPIETLDGKILDGRRRYMACRSVGVTPQFKAVKVDDPVAYVLSLNLHRRHLTPSQLSMVGARATSLREKLETEAKERKSRKPESVRENLPAQNGRVRDAIGKTVGVSGKSIDHARRVLDKGIPELAKAVDQGRMAISTAAILATEPPERQLEEINQPKRARVYKASEGGGNGEPVKRTKDEDDEHTEGERRGVGIIRANEAINSLKRIPKNDALRKRGFQLVTDWIRRNK